MAVDDAVGAGPVATDGEPVWKAAPHEVARTFPPLHSAVARPVTQDRWERLVSEIMIPVPAGRVWQGLVDKDAVGEWLALCFGGWAQAGEESMLDFEDGEYFYCRTDTAEAATEETPGRLRYLWRWVGIGPATCVTWDVVPRGAGTTLVTVTEESTNPPSDWRSWNGMGWPGILEQLASHLRTGTRWRWPWRRMGPYIQAEISAPPFEAWEALTSSSAVKHWLQRTAGSFTVDDPMTLTMGDASGTVRLETTKVVDAGQSFPSYLPYIEFRLRRAVWERALGGQLWIEPAGLGHSLLEVFHFDWEGLQLRDPLEERRILTGFWVSAFQRAQRFFKPPTGTTGGPHSWST